MTPIQLRSLRLYLSFKDKPMSVWLLLRYNAKLYGFLFLLFTAAAAIIYALYGLVPSLFVVMAFSMLVLRDIGLYRRTAQIWPCLNGVLDWGKVEELVNAHTGKP
jgi:hypothetical protein